VYGRPQKHLDQRSLCFATFNGETVLEVTGNYYAVYLREGMDANERARRTFEDVLLPILRRKASWDGSGSRPSSHWSDCRR